MSEIKCPVCQNKLHKINIIVSTCTNDKCKLWGSSIPNLVLEALARTEQNLERTRKALDVANAVIMNYAKEKLEQKESVFVHNKIEFPEYNDNLLEEFDKQFFENGQDDDLTETALEQKD